ncbi:MAG: DUF420 domain-containing protein [Hyphomicrobium sp.]|nr:DUF420 domain-containing protein [Hyphomicrobium sp.]
MASNTVLPHVLAVINASTIAALSGGYYFIKRGDRARHRTCMMAAVALGVAFLVLYLAYHFGAGLAKFGGQGIIRPVYFTILIIHIIAAAIATPVVPLAFWRAWNGNEAAHRRLAPFAWKLWLFVAASGIVVYVMTIHIWPFAGVAP